MSIAPKIKKSGFTIVELLIVIVVIGILAAITVIAYRGIQNRANDIAVQSDLKNISTKLQMYNVDNGAYPRGVYGITTKESELQSLKIKLSFDAYWVESNNNMSYCSYIDGSNAKYTILGKSKSGNVFSLSSNGGISPQGQINLSTLSAICPIYGYTMTDANFTSTWGWESGYMKWRAWTGGSGS